jgi:polyketide synthase 12/myxalamid-type polyketide synthase MxaB/epothilone polyketide synthase D
MVAMSHSTVVGSDEPSTPSGPAELRQQLEEAIPGERSELLEHYVRSTVAQLLQLSTLRCVAPDDRLRDLGIDSLMAVELRDRLCAGLDYRPLPPTLVFDYPTCRGIAGFLERALLGAGGVAAASPVPTTPPDPSQAERLGDLSDAEVATLLLQKLARR